MQQFSLIAIVGLSSTRWPSIRQASTLSSESQRLAEYRENKPTLY